MQPLCITLSHCRFHTLIGAGGIGSGVFFALNGSHTLGREESRSGRFLDRRDYCKLHIVAHYVQTLMGSEFTALPLGMVGDDDQGRKLLDEMNQAGLDTRHVRTTPEKPTLHCICLLYPDGSGGNLTVDDSACSQVTPEFIQDAEPDIAAASRAGMALALPEVPLAAREKLLELATRHGCLRAASFTSEEIPTARDTGILSMVDLLAVNTDEAAALTDAPSDRPPVKVAEAAVAYLQRAHPALKLSVTAGIHGSWIWDGATLSHAPAHKVKIAGTAGAGDAHLAGILAGLAAGLPLVEAQPLGTLTAALSVTSPHTIHKEIDRESLKTLVDRLHLSLPNGIRLLLGT